MIERAINHAGLPTDVKNLTTEKILEIMSFDKKTVKKKILWSLPKKIGEVVVDIEVPNKLVVQALKQIL